MANEVKLFQKESTYKDKSTGSDKTATNFYVQCGNMLVPIQIKFFADEAGKDLQYASRKAVLKSFAEPLPPKDAK